MKESVIAYISIEMALKKAECGQGLG
jgi:hypothetical protein